MMDDGLPQNCFADTARTKILFVRQYTYYVGNPMHVYIIRRSSVCRSTPKALLSLFVGANGSIHSSGGG
jgi:hypothetical protein